MRQNGEPSVEEILQSIKQVIARDSRITPAPSGQPLVVRSRREDALADDPYFDDEDNDVLELNETAQLPKQPVAEAPAAPAVEQTQYFRPKTKAEPVPIPQEDEEEPLMQQDTRNSTRESLATLAMLSEPGAKPQIVRSGETSLESMTRELLRPALSEWLDKNLPPIVERLVAAEISRIVGKKG